MKDEKGKRFFLVVVPHEKRADLKQLGKELDAKGLRFVDADLLKKYLGVEPGSVTMLGLMCDTEHMVEVIFDTKIWQADAINCHPLVNTASLVIAHQGVEDFLHATNHIPRVIEVPARV